MRVVTLTSVVGMGSIPTSNLPIPRHAKGRSRLRPEAVMRLIATIVFILAAQAALGDGPYPILPRTGRPPMVAFGQVGATAGPAPMLSQTAPGLICDNR